MKRRLSAALAAAALTGTAVVVGAQMASANTWAGSCSQGSLGRVCISPGSRGYTAQYWNNTSNATYVDFNLIIKSSGKHVGDRGAFTAQPGTGPYSYYFATGDQGCAEVALYDRTAHEPPVYSGWSC